MLPNGSEKLDPRVKRTRSMIEQAFMSLLSEKGFQTLSVQDIAEKAGINRATFYAHYPDKFSLLEHFVRTEFQTTLHKWSLNVCQFSPENLRSLVIAVCEFVVNFQEHCSSTEQQFRMLIAVQVRLQVYELILHWLENQDTGLKFKYTPERSAIAASWAIYGLATEWSRSRLVQPVEQYADEVLPLVSATLGLTQEPA